MASPKMPDGLPSRVTVCGQCVRHQGGAIHDLRKKEEAHQEIWRDYCEGLLADAEVTRRRLQAEIDGLREELEERPVRTVEVNEDLARIEESEKQRSQAYYSRDMAFQRLSRVGMLHRELEPGKCRCGSLGQCKTAALISEDSDLARWEARQWKLLRDGRKYDCMLPEGHPGRTDSRWHPGES